MGQSADRPNRGRNRMPIRQPGNAAANQTQPCSEPDATPETKAPILQPNPSRAPHPISSPPISAAASDFIGGQAVTANGLVAAAAAMAPNNMPKSVRLEVSDSTEPSSACLAPAHCQNGACEKSKPSALKIFAPHTVKPKVTLQGWPPAIKTATQRRPMTRPPTM